MECLLQMFVRLGRLRTMEQLYKSDVSMMSLQLLTHFHIISAPLSLSSPSSIVNVLQSSSVHDAVHTALPPGDGLVGYCSGHPSF